MSKQLRELQARKAALVKEARGLTDTAAADSRDLNDEEVTAFDALRTRIDAASVAIDRETALIADEARLSVASVIGPIVTDNREADPSRGFGSMGEFMQAVYQAEKPGQPLLARVPQRVRVDAADRPRAVPIVPESAARIDAAAADVVPATGPLADTAVCETLAEDAAQTTLMVVEFQRWYREQARAFAVD